MVSAREDVDDTYMYAAFRHRCRRIHDPSQLTYILTSHTLPTADRLRKITVSLHSDLPSMAHSRVNQQVLMRADSQTSHGPVYTFAEAALFVSTEQLS